jgi:hypothetical protein
MTEWITNQPEGTQILFMIASAILFSLAVNLYRKSIVLYLVFITLSVSSGYLYLNATINNNDAIESIAVIFYVLVIIVAGLKWGEHIKQSKITKEERRNELQGTIDNAKTTIDNATKQLNDINPMK